MKTRSQAKLETSNKEMEAEKPKEQAALEKEHQDKVDEVAAATAALSVSDENDGGGGDGDQAMKTMNTTVFPGLPSEVRAKVLRFLGMQDCGQLRLVSRTMNTFMLKQVILYKRIVVITIQTEPEIKLQPYQTYKVADIESAQVLLGYHRFAKKLYLANKAPGPRPELPTNLLACDTLLNLVITNLTLPAKMMQTLGENLRFLQSLVLKRNHMSGENLGSLGKRLQKLELQQCEGLRKRFLHGAFVELYAKEAPLKIIRLKVTFDYQPDDYDGFPIVAYLFENFSTLDWVELIKYPYERIVLNTMVATQISKLIIEGIKSHEDLENTFYQALFSQRLPNLKKLHLLTRSHPVSPAIVARICETCPAVSTVALKYSGHGFASKFQRLRMLNNLELYGPLFSDADIVRLVDSPARQRLILRFQDNRGDRVTLPMNESKELLELVTAALAWRTNANDLDIFYLILPVCHESVRQLEEFAVGANVLLQGC